MLKVLINKAGRPPEQFSFGYQTLMIGRADGNDLCLRDGKGVSRYHARVDCENNCLVIQDLNSTNGIFVNGRQTEKMVITPDDVVLVGDYKLQFSSESVDSQVEKRESNESCKDDERVDQDLENQLKSANLINNETKDQAPTTEQDFYWSSLKNFLQPVWEYLLNDQVTEILINGPGEVYTESKGQLSRVGVHFSEAELKAAVLNISQYVGRRVTEEEPYLDARLPDGSRVAVLMPPCSRKGIAVAIRKFSKDALTLEKLLSFGSLSCEMVSFLKACVSLRKNLIVSGGTSSGKTSLLNVVSSLIPEDERIITIEDSAELQLKQEHVLPMETRPPDKKGRGQVTIRDLVKTSLRMRPDRIIVGEIRGGEALDLLQAMNTGHSGSMATVHASSPPQALTRLETLALFSGLEIPVRALREQVSSAVEIIVQAARLPDHSRKVINISEVLKLGGDEQYQVRDIFVYKRTGVEDGKIQGGHIQTGVCPVWIDEMKMAGLDEVVSIFERK